MPIHEHPPVPKESAFRGWLEDQKLSEKTVQNIVSNCRRAYVKAGKLPSHEEEIPLLIKSLDPPTDKVSASFSYALRKYVKFLQD